MTTPSRCLANFRMVFPQAVDEADVVVAARVVAVVPRPQPARPLQLLQLPQLLQPALALLRQVALLQAAHLVAVKAAVAAAVVASLVPLP